MDSNQDRLTALWGQWQQGQLSDAERAEMMQLLREPDGEKVVMQLINVDTEKVDNGSLSIDRELASEKLESIFTKIVNTKPEVPVTSITHIVSMRWMRWAATAAIFIIILSAGYFLFLNKKTGHDELVNNNQSNDVRAPETNRAMITFADGRTIALDSLTSGTLVTQGNVNVVKTSDGKISYTGSAKEMVYNTLTNPRGSKVIDMTLADGSHVWLNAGSSVHYPIAFVGNERKISITGEAYFEITHDALKPFKVSKGDMIVTVLGTHFNVNAYDDEKDIKVTLLEGSVKVSNGAGEALLKPGQQANLTTNHKPQTTNTVDIDAVMAWKNGLFDCNGLDLTTILRQAARWYDVDVVYQTKPTKEVYMGSIPHNVNLSELLKILRISGVKFVIEGKKLIVM